MRMCLCITWDTPLVPVVVVTFGCNKSLSVTVDDFETVMRLAQRCLVVRRFFGGGRLSGYLHVFVLCLNRHHGTTGRQ